MLSLNTNNLPYFLYEESNSIPVIFEQRVAVVLTNTLNAINYANKPYIWDALVDAKVNTSLNVPTHLQGQIFDDKIILYGNGTTWRYEVHYEDFILSLKYDIVTQEFAAEGIPESLYQAKDLKLNPIPYVENISFVQDLFNESIRFSSLLTEIINHITYKNRKFLPEIYYNEFPNSIPVMVEKALTQIIDDVESFKINDWTDLKVVQKEFHFDTVFGTNSPILNIKDVNLIKGLFSIKGTEMGLRFLLKYLNVEVIVYYAPEIRELKLVSLPDHLVTECDIVIDLTLGKNQSLGLDENGQIDPDYDRKFKDLVNKVMSICLNILAFTFKKRFFDPWIDVNEYGVKRNNNLWESTYNLEDLEQIVDQHRPKFNIEPNLECPLYMNGMESYYPLSYYDDPISYDGTYIYYPEHDPIDFGDPDWSPSCTWYSNSKIQNIDIDENFHGTAHRDNITRYDESNFMTYSDDSSIEYKEMDVEADLYYTDHVTFSDDSHSVSSVFMLQPDSNEITSSQVLTTHYQNTYRIDGDSMFYDDPNLMYEDPRWSDSINVLIDES